MNGLCRRLSAVLFIFFFFDLRPDYILLNSMASTRFRSRNSHRVREKNVTIEQSVSGFVQRYFSRETAQISIIFNLAFPGRVDKGKSH